MDNHNATMIFMTELDNHIRHYRGINAPSDEKIPRDEKVANNQLIMFMRACKKLDANLLEIEMEKLKNVIGTLLYETLEMGHFTPEFSLVWTTNIQQVNTYYNRCHSLIPAIVEP